jgi:hypothetical protein
MSAWGQVDGIACKKTTPDRYSPVRMEKGRERMLRIYT